MPVSKVTTFKSAHGCIVECKKKNITAHYLQRASICDVITHVNAKFKNPFQVYESISEGN